MERGSAGRCEETESRHGSRHGHFNDFNGEVLDQMDVFTGFHGYTLVHCYGQLMNQHDLAAIFMVIFKMLKHQRVFTTQRLMFFPRQA